MLKRFSLRTRLVAVIAFIAIGVCGILSTLFLQQQAQMTELALNREMTAEYQSVLAAFDYERKTVLALASFGANLPEAREGFAAGDRQRLVAMLTDSHNAIKTTLGYDVMNFHKPPAINFLRIQNPKLFDDDISARRKLVVTSNQDGQARSGIEPSLSTLSIFGTVPVIQGNQRLGVFEIGMQVGKPFVDTIKSRFGIDIAIHLEDGNNFTTAISTLPNKTTASVTEYAPAFAGTPVIRRAVLDGNPVAVYFGQIKNYSGAPIAVVEIVKNIADFEAITTNTRNYMIAAAFIVLIAAVGLALVLALGLTRPIIRMTAAMERLSAGDATTEIPSRERRDEIGHMAGAVQVFKDNMQEMDRLRAEREEMEKRTEAEKKATVNKMANEFEASVKGLVKGVSASAGQMQTSAQSMSMTAEETSRQAMAVAAASEQASTNVQTVASAAEELSSSIVEISRQVTQSSRITAKAVEEAGRTDAQIQGLNEAAQKIGDVVKLINDIASQTNLLALNATIEAARAGEAGKGFAVVASEVKSLATQTAKATEDIAAQVTSIQAATGDAVQAIKHIAGTIGEVNEIATSIASAVEEQGAATKEIARNVQQASAGTNEVSSNIASVTNAAGETGSAAAQVLGAAGNLSNQADRLTTEVDGFLSRIRAA
jgi:methyl-accepting chemotaxis protein